MSLVLQSCCPQSCADDQRLIEEKKRAVLAAHGSGLEKGTEIGKDLLSLCIKANMGSDLRPDQKMTDDEILGQITTFVRLLT